MRLPVLDNAQPKAYRMCFLSHVVSRPLRRRRYCDPSSRRIYDDGNVACRPVECADAAAGLWVGIVSAPVPYSRNISLIINESRSCKSLFSALAAADCTVFLTSVAAGVVINRSVSIASSTGAPRTRSITCLSFVLENPDEF